MKNILRFFAAAAIACGTAGCTDFLDLPAKNEQTIETITDVRLAFNGYLRGVDASNTTFATQVSAEDTGPIPLVSSAMVRMFEAYSDNIDANEAMLKYLVPTNNYATWESYRRWFLWSDYSTTDFIWNGYYSGIGFTNTLIWELEGIDPASDPEEWCRVMGEMRMHRAFFFFKLLQYFAPYDNNEQGIPVYLNTGSEGVLGVKPARATHTYVYATILADLAEAERLLAETTPRSTFNIFFRKDRLSHLMAQVYWFKAESPAAETTDWANAAKYARQVVDEVPEEVIPTTGSDIMRAGMKNGRPGYTGHYLAVGPSGGYQTLAIYGHSAMAGQPKEIPANQELFDLFETGDVRLGVRLSDAGTPEDAGDDTWDGYFQGNTPVINRFWHGVQTVSATALSASGNGRAMLFKPEEAYLILAEALHHTGGNAGAVLDKFKSFRNAGGTGKTGADLLQEILNERRKEFFMDYDKRWLDLKKYGGATIVRNLTFPESEQEVYDGNVNPLYKAVPGGYQYALPIPATELQTNPNITQNPGWTGQEL